MGIKLTCKQLSNIPIGSSGSIRERNRDGETADDMSVAG